MIAISRFSLIRLRPDRGFCLSHSRPLWALAKALAAVPEKPRPRRAEAGISVSVSGSVLYAIMRPKAQIPLSTIRRAPEYS